jgi:hypothetical protein
VGKALRRDEVLGTAVAKNAFTIADTVLTQDQRVSELLGAWQIDA